MTIYLFILSILHKNTPGIFNYNEKEIPEVVFMKNYGQKIEILLVDKDKTIKADVACPTHPLLLQLWKKLIFPATFSRQHY